MPTSLDTPKCEAPVVVAAEKMDDPKAAVRVTKPRDAATGSLQKLSVSVADNFNVKHLLSLHGPVLSMHWVVRSIKFDNILLSFRKRRRIWLATTKVWQRFASL